MGVKLAKVRIKNYRSLAQRDGMNLVLGNGMNSFVGPNNVGKSNVMRAVALAFGEDVDGFDLDRDSPAGQRRSFPQVTLEFRVENPTQAEKTLLARARAVENEVNPGEPTYAALGKVVLRVTYSAEGRQEYLITRGAGNRRAVERTNAKAIEQLHRCVRFVHVRSGEALDEFLRGRFSDVLANVLRETQGQLLDEARAQREAYVDGLQQTLLASISERVHEELSEIVPEIGRVDLVPRVPGVEETIQSAEVVLCDAAATDVSAKGTGVRGGLLVAMLRYLAQSSRRSLVFAIEEPESFLHPSAQEVIREDLEGLAESPDITLLVSTHSPVVLSRAAAARHFALTKDREGTTCVGETAAGDAQHTRVISGLYRSSLLPQLLEEVAGSELPSPCTAVLVVEGWTDRMYLEAAAARVQEPELLSDIHIVVGEGAKQAAVQAVVWKSRGVSPVVVLLDGDQPGRSAKDMLTKDFKFEKSQVPTYNKWIDPNAPDVEAEHLLPESVFKRFLKIHGEGALDARRRYKDTWFYEIHKDYKGIFGLFVTEQATSRELAPFVRVLRDLRKIAQG